ncbi:Na-translocating system protein MpsC family protein [Bacillus suaedae]|uniref:DUF2294 family protein n=1 Tax=Halalkalibacter suaedae TaxID=2822140 RepID=A0A941AQB4_9BACI|nr:Na-translocating system protein MpsC family protein [Bacillus suaedae]MBP3952437.1 DUF2294 family protein [Bacillus suaedae]
MIKSEDNKQELLLISSYISKQLKQKFGKGPETCYSIIKENVMAVRVQQFRTPAEDVLLHKNELGLALKFRSVIMKAIFEELKQEIYRITGFKAVTFFHDWNYESNIGLILLFDDPTPVMNSKFESKEDSLLCEQVQIVSSRVHKTPSDVNLLKMNSSLYIFESKDVMIRTEHLLHEKGFSDILFERSRDIQQRFNHYRGEFELIINKSISDICIMWDYKNNKSYSVFWLK